MPTYLNQVHVPLISYFPCCHKFCCIYRLSNGGRKKNGRKPPHSKMFSTVWHGCYPGSLTPAEVAACFSLILAKTFFTGHEDWMVLISTAEDSHRKSVVMKKTWVKKQGLKFWRKNITVVIGSYYTWVGKEMRHWLSCVMWSLLHFFFI